MIKKNQGLCYQYPYSQSLVLQVDDWVFTNNDNDKKDNNISNYDNNNTKEKMKEK